MLISPKFPSDKLYRSSTLKKYILYLFFSVISTFSTFSNEMNEYKIIGTLPDSVNGIYMYLTCLWSSDSLQFSENHNILDSAYVHNGNFIFNGTVDGVDKNLYEIRSEDQKWNGWVVVEPGSISYTYEFHETKGQALARGTYWNDLLTDSILIPTNKLARFGEFFINKQINRNDPEMAETINRMKEYSKAYYNRLVWFMNENIHIPIGEYVFLMYSTIFKEKDLVNILPRLSENALLKYNASRVIKPTQSVLLGQQYIPFEVRTFDNKNFNLSSIIGQRKLILLDFWASWCGPCIIEIPKLVDLYNEFNDKGLEIIGISTDKDEIEWRKAVEKFNMNWIQVINGKEKNSNAVEIYNVQFIPYTILIDSNGRIIDINLRGEKLFDRIKSLLN